MSSDPSEVNPPQSLRELQALSLAELDRLFQAGRVPRFEDFAGPTQGAWLHRERQPWWAAAFVRVTLDSPWARWSGKGFVLPFDERQAGAGINLFRNRVLPLRLQFETRVTAAHWDGRPCLALVYPRGSVLRGLVDDVRQVGEGLLLGRMEYRFPMGRAPRTVGYFALARSLAGLRYPAG